MSEPKFTPGPWEVSPTGKYVRRVQPNYSVCMLSDAVLDDWIANARLIAAAPEMLAALVEARQYVAGEIPSEDGDVEDLLSRIDAALAKAEGR